ncbi:TatA/E family twin arginine-targeting protein translocase [Cyanobium sp. AMD-g]|uniref:TatA/E family twin arginine-targeting protein translocase n=1 Tax=Cyanobium sp. AMD-g TaxID=2823699 RepID=UPI0020CB888F|nr:TatA/E family twin arginine-targeting protein translocase [Cyanobium sp. AMD-g]MCP9931093.1 TatA/E family twin arginine-targeting protein translocase [Cyanobium sp. AMD-g]
MNIFGIGLPEMAVIAAIGLLVFGPKRLPELGKTLGRTLRGFQSASQEFEKEFRTAVGTEQPIDISGPPAAITPAAEPPVQAAVVEESATPSNGPAS